MENETLDNNNTNSQQDSSEVRTYTKDEFNGVVAQRQEFKTKYNEATARIDELEKKVNAIGKPAGKSEKIKDFSAEDFARNLEAKIAPEIMAKIENNANALRDEKLSGLIQDYRAAGLQETKISEIMEKHSDIFRTKPNVTQPPVNRALGGSGVSGLTAREQEFCKDRGLTEAEFKHYGQSDHSFASAKGDNLFGARKI